jgi:hypothetical protein
MKRLATDATTRPTPAPRARKKGRLSLRTALPIQAPSKAPEISPSSANTVILVAFTRTFTFEPESDRFGVAREGTVSGSAGDDVRADP